MSRLPSARGAKAAKTPAGKKSGGTRGGGGAGGRPGVYVQTPKSDIFVVMLGVALGAMVIGTLLMVLILNSYGFKTKVSAVTPTPTGVALA
ncbi:MAG: hypothetical protein KGM43_07445 [Planctomycetota bacterium]|nr:hypothetical protein [Planctomycetota bacterium]